MTDLDHRLPVFVDDLERALAREVPARARRRRTRRRAQGAMALALVAGLGAVLAWPEAETTWEAGAPAARQATTVPTGPGVAFLVDPDRLSDPANWPAVRDELESAGAHLATAFRPAAAEDHRGLLRFGLDDAAGEPVHPDETVTFHVSPGSTLHLVLSVAWPELCSATERWDDAEAAARDLAAAGFEVTRWTVLDPDRGQRSEVDGPQPGSAVAEVVAPTSPEGGEDARPRRLEVTLTPPGKPRWAGVEGCSSGRAPLAEGAGAPASGTGG